MMLIPSLPAATMLVLLFVVFEPACVSSSGSHAWSWRHEVLWAGRDKIQSIALGELVPECEGPEVVGVDAAGKVILISGIATEPRAEVLHEHGAKLTGLLIADLDPAAPGAELYVGGHREDGSGGAVVQIVLDGSDVRIRTVWLGEGFVHALAWLGSPGASPSLVITSYAGEVWIATPKRGGGPWPKRLLHREPGTGDSEGLKIKDVLAGPIGGTTPRVFIAVKSGRGVLIDTRQQEAPVLLHEEPGGIARLALGPSGDLLLAGNEGRVVRLSRTLRGGWTESPLYRDIKKLRGIAPGRFRTPTGSSPLAVFGHAGLCRLLTERNGGWDSFTIYDDGAPGHWLAAGNIIPGNDSDELVCAGYSGRIVMAYVAGP
ncbi:MAG: hypothetical protein ACE5F1_00370 [Planctomycetota bacterium]